MWPRAVRASPVTQQPGRIFAACRHQRRNARPRTLPCAGPPLADSPLVSCPLVYSRRRSMASTRRSFMSKSTLASSCRSSWSSVFQIRAFAKAATASEARSGTRGGSSPSTGSRSTRLQPTSAKPAPHSASRSRSASSPPRGCWNPTRLLTRLPSGSSRSTATSSRPRGCSPSRLWRAGKAGASCCPQRTRWRQQSCRASSSSPWMRSPA